MIHRYIYIFLFIILLMLEQKVLPSGRLGHVGDWRKIQSKAFKQGWVRGSALFEEWHFAEYAWNPQKVIPFDNKGNPALNSIVNKNTRLQIKKVTATQVQLTRSNLWVLRHLLRVFPYHWGYLVSQRKVPLRKEPSDTAEIMGFLSGGLRLTPIQFQGSYVQIEWKDRLYFIPFHNLLSRLNFAKKIKVGSDWKDVLFVMGAWVKTTDGQFVGLNQIEGMVGRSHLAYVMASQTAIRSQPQLQGSVLQVVQQFTPLAVLENKQLSHFISKRVITTDQLFARKIFDMASQERVMWASANGIFRSFDGNLWEKLLPFKEQDFPLVISPSGKLYVGPYRSLDDGRSFQQYIRWDLVFNALKGNGIHSVSELRMKDLEFLNQSDRTLKMTLHIGRDWKKKVKLAQVISYDEGASWHPIKK